MVTKIPPPPPQKKNSLESESRPTIETTVAIFRLLKSKKVAHHSIFNLVKHANQNMSNCGLSLHKATRKSPRNPREKQYPGFRNREARMKVRWGRGRANPHLKKGEHSRRVQGMQGGSPSRRCFSYPGRTNI